MIMTLILKAFVFIIYQSMTHISFNKYFYVRLSLYRVFWKVTPQMVGRLMEGVWNILVEKNKFNLLLLNHGINEIWASKLTRSNASFQMETTV